MINFDFEPLRTDGRLVFPVDTSILINLGYTKTKINKIESSARSMRDGK